MTFSLTSSLFNTFWNTTSQSIGLPSLIDIDTLSSSTATSTATFIKKNNFNEEILSQHANDDDDDDNTTIKKRYNLRSNQ